MFAYWDEFLAISALQFIALMSPGPDFAVIMREALLRGRRSASYCSVGIALGIVLHSSYCILGLGVVISKSVLAFQILKLIGAAYLIYIGAKALFSKVKAEEKDEELKQGEVSSKPSTALAALRLGFFTNALNPKATLFILSLFSVAISPETPASMQAFYAFWISFLTFAWFFFLSNVVGGERVRLLVGRAASAIERVTGAFLVGAGAVLALSD